MSRSVVVLDHGSGNLRSAERALARTGADVTVTGDAAAALEADGLVVPGVGAFAACMRGLDAVGGGALVRERLERGRPVLGICVGMQVLFEQGVEHGITTDGCAEWPGAVERLHAPVLPHMGWNTVDVPDGSALFAGLEQERFYFVHSYAAQPESGTVEDTLTTSAVHGVRFAAGIERGVLSATQFHPEKSGDAGAALLANWVATL